MGTAESRPQPVAPTPELRHRVANAARELFAAQGYEQTTVDAIAERAGVGRRTFFRYFRSKDDAIFPDHRRITEAVTNFLAVTSEPPVRAVCGAARLVFRSYVQDRAVSVQRYTLSRSVPALRDREVVTDAEYSRIFSRFLVERFSGTPHAQLRADVVAAAIVAAHNQVLREWLRLGATGDPLPDLDVALGWVAAAFEGTRREAPRRLQPGMDPGADRDVVVAVFHATDPIDDVMKRISRAL